VSITALDLNLLLVLHTVLTERSVARAARRLHVTPSAVSNGLAKLRVALEDPLVTRRGRGIVPTPRATELAPALARAVSELERALTQVPFDAATCTRTFTLAMGDAGQVAWLPEIAAAFSRSMPRARLRVVGIDALLSLGDLASPEVDLHVGMRATGPGIHAEALFEERTTLAARKGSPSGKGKLTRRELGMALHVGVEMAPGRGFRDVIGARYARARIERRVIMTVPSFAAAAAVVSTTDLVATLPLGFFEAQAARLSLLEVKGPVPAYQVPIAMCWHARTHADPAMLAFRNLVRAATRS
jgi:DNA-binding transcriptional LysR family regulator